MELHDQVCTLAQAKRLKELGVPQNSIWYAQELKEPVPDGCATHRLQLYTNVGHPIEQSVVSAQYAAFTSAELGEMLPARFKTEKSSDRYESEKGRFYTLSSIQGECSRKYAPTEAQARAEMLIHLLESGKLNASEVNL